MNPVSRRTVLKTLLASAALVTGPTRLVQAQMPAELRLGWQKGSDLAVVRARGVIERLLAQRAVAVRWVEFPAGPQMLEALAVGSIDLGEVGETPPVFSQAAGAELRYVANRPPSPHEEALLVPQASPVRTVADLSGKRVSLNKGSNVHYLSDTGLNP
jgi:sulfonate transport system substrate-binding protein